MREVSFQKHNIMVGVKCRPIHREYSGPIFRPVVMQGLNSWLIFSFFCS